MALYIIRKKSRVYRQYIPINLLEKHKYNMFLSLRKTLIFAISITSKIGASVLNDFIEKNDKNCTNCDETAYSQSIYNLQDKTVASTNNVNVSELAELLQIYETDVDFYSNFTIPSKLLQNIEINSSQTYDVNNNLIAHNNYDLIEKNDTLATFNVESQSVTPYEKSSSTYFHDAIDKPISLYTDQINNKNNLQNSAQKITPDVHNTNHTNLKTKILNSNIIYDTDIKVNNSSQINEYSHYENDSNVNKPVRSNDQGVTDYRMNIFLNNYSKNEIDCTSELPLRCNGVDRIKHTSDLSQTEHIQAENNYISKPILMYSNLNEIECESNDLQCNYNQTKTDYTLNTSVRGVNPNEIVYASVIFHCNDKQNKPNCITEIPLRSYNKNESESLSDIVHKNSNKCEANSMSNTLQGNFNECGTHYISKNPKCSYNQNNNEHLSEIPNSITKKCKFDFISDITKSIFDHSKKSYISDLPNGIHENNEIDYASKMPDTNYSYIKTNVISNTPNLNNMYNKLECTSEIQKDKNIVNKEIDTTYSTFKNNIINKHPLDIYTGQKDIADKSNKSDIRMLNNSVVNPKVQDNIKNANQKFVDLNESVNRNIEYDKHVPAYTTKYSLRTRKNQHYNHHKHLIKKNQDTKKLFMYNSQGIEKNSNDEHLIDGFNIDDTESLISAAQKNEKLLKNKNNIKIVMEFNEKNTISNNKNNQNVCTLLGKRKKKFHESARTKNIKLSDKNEHKDSYLHLFEKKLLATNWNEMIIACLIQRCIDKDKIISKEEENFCLKDLSNGQYSIINESKYTDLSQTVIKHTQIESEEELEKFKTQNKTYCIGLYLLSIDNQIKEIYRDDFRLGKSDKKFIYYVDKNTILNVNAFLNNYRYFMISQIINKGLSNYFSALSDTDEKFCTFKILYSFYQTSINEIIYMINLGCITYNIFLEKLMRPNFKHKNLISMNIRILIDYFYALIDKLNKNLNHPIHKYLVELYFFQSYLVDKVKKLNLTLFDEELLVLIYFIYIFEYICDNIRHPNFQVTKNIAKKNHEKILNCPTRNIFLYIKLEIKRIFAHIIKLTVTQECILQYLNLIVIEEICNSYYTKKLFLRDDDQNFNVYCKQFNLFFVTRLFFLLFGYNNILLGLYDFKRTELSVLYNIVAKLTPSELVVFCSRKIRVFKSLFILCYYIKNEQLAIDKTRLIVLNERIKKILLKYYISFPNNVNFEKDFENFIILNSLTSYTSNLYVHDEEMSSLFNEIFCIMRKEEKRFFYF